MDTQDNKLSKFQILQTRLQNSQFVYGLDVRTLLPIEIAASVIGKSCSTFRSDLIRRPHSLPQVTRRHGRVFVVVGDLINWLAGSPSVSPIIPHTQTSIEPPTKRKRGRPTKVEQQARLTQSQSAGV